MVHPGHAGNSHMTLSLPITFRGRREELVSKYTSSCLDQARYSTQTGKNSWTRNAERRPWGGYVVGNDIREERLHPSIRGRGGER